MKVSLLYYEINKVQSEPDNVTNTISVAFLYPVRMRVRKPDSEWQKDR
jgi:hypothetical protein